jgi:hypothetical protein
MSRRTLVGRTLPVLVAAVVMAGEVPAAATTSAADEIAATVLSAAADAGVGTVPVTPTVREGETLVATTTASPAEVTAAVAAATDVASAIAEDADLTPEETEAFAELVSEAAANEASATVTVNLPVDPTSDITVDSSTTVGAEITLGLPTTGEHRDAQVTTDGTVVYQDRTGLVDVAAQPIQDGSVRVHTVLNGPEAPSELVYSLGLPQGVTAQITADGGVDMVRAISVLDAETGEELVEDVPVGRVAPAWAVDAQGKAVPSWYELRDQQLVQFVDHTSGEYNYPITADPWWSTAYKVAKCAAAIAFVALTTVFVVGKAIKIVKAVNAARHWVNSVGGAREAAKLLVGASTPAERAHVLTQARNIAGASVLDFFGITQIKEGCF